VCSSITVSVRCPAALPVDSVASCCSVRFARLSEPTISQLVPSVSGRPV